MAKAPSAEDRSAIEAVLVEYVHAIDARDFDLLDGVFTPDAWIDYTAMGGIAAAYPEMKRWLSQVLPAFPGYCHLLGMSRILLDSPDEAQSRTACFNPMRVPMPENREEVMFLGLWYVDSWQRTDAGWRICRRHEEKCFDHNVPAALHQAVGSR